MPVGIQTTRTINEPLLRKGLNSAIFLGPDVVPDYSKMIPMQHFSDSQKFAQWASYGSLPTAPEVAEGSPTPVYSIATRWTKTLYIVKDAISTSLTKEALKTDQYGVFTVSMHGKMMRNSLDQKQNVRLADVMNGGFTNSGTYAGWDGSAFFASDHATEIGNIGVNTIGSAGSYTVSPLSPTNLGILMGVAQATVTDQGEQWPIIMAGGKLVVPSALDEPSKRYLKGSEQPGTANREMSVIKGAFEAMTFPYLVNQFNWFVFLEDNNMFELTRMERESQFYWNQSNWEYVASTMQEKTYSFTDWRRSFGVKGA